MNSAAQSEEVEKDKSNNEEKKKTRRTRKDEEGRNFTCPCGKSYLSYPALYTHVKTKHEGKVKLFIFRPRKNSSTKAAMINLRLRRRVKTKML